MSRKFGIEIEAYNADKFALADSLNAAGVPCAVEGYNHTTRSHWKIVTDASLGGLRNGFELVSPVLEGEDGFEQIRKVCSVLAAHGAKVSKECGFHTHVDARDLSVKQLGNVVKMFAKYETCFDKIVAPSRRDNRMCQSVTNGRDVAFMFAEINKAQTIDALRMSVNFMSRYKKLNLESLVRHGTVEFRQHGGTVEAQKIIQWVKLVTGFVAEAAAAKTIRTTGAGKFENLMACTDAAGRKFFAERAAHFAV